MLAGVLAILAVVGGVWWFKKTGGAARFISLAQEAACADQRNEIFQIDNHYYFWAREGSCSDASYSYTLYKDSPKNLVCSKEDSIAGAQFSCTDKDQESNFKKMIKHVDAADLGLGSDHTIRKLDLKK